MPIRRPHTRDRRKVQPASKLLIGAGALVNSFNERTSQTQFTFQLGMIVTPFPAVGNDALTTPIEIPDPATADNLSWKWRDDGGATNHTVTLVDVQTDGIITVTVPSAPVGKGTLYFDGLDPLFAELFGTNLPPMGLGFQEWP